MAVIPLLRAHDLAAPPPVPRTGLCQVTMHRDPAMPRAVVHDILTARLLEMMLPTLQDGRNYCIQLGPLRIAERCGLPGYIQTGLLTLAQRDDARLGEHVLVHPPDGGPWRLDQRVRTGWKTIPLPMEEVRYGPT